MGFGAASNMLPPPEKYQPINTLAKHGFVFFLTLLSCIIHLFRNFRQQLQRALAPEARFTAAVEANAVDVVPVTDNKRPRTHPRTLFVATKLITIDFKEILIVIRFLETDVGDFSHVGVVVLDDLPVCRDDCHIARARALHLVSMELGTGTEHHTALIGHPKLCRGSARNNNIPTRLQWHAAIHGGRV